MRDEREFARRQRHHAVIHDLEVQALQVRDVTGRVERKYLAFAFLGDLVAADEAFDDKAGFRWTIPLTDDVVVGTNASGGERQGQEAVLLLL